MSRSFTSLALPKYLLFIFFLTFIATSLSGCGEDAFTTDEPPANSQNDPNTPDPVNAPGAGTTPPTTTTNVFFGVGSGTNFIQGVLDVGVTAPLSARGTTTITGYLIDDNGDPYTSPVAFEFTSTCVENGTASIDSPVTSVNGVVHSTYRAEGCSGSDVIVATGTVNNNNLSASGSITVQPAAVGAIEFISAEPEIISLEGTAGLGLTESSTVTFRVVDNAGRPVAGANVNFSLSTTVGGITLDNGAGTTAADGTVQVSVSSGTVNTSVRVVASADTGTATVTTQSVALAISTGIPDKDSFEIVAAKLRPHTWEGECSGEEVTITAFASDQFNNPAPNGTAVAFQAEGGSIQGSCLIENGQCSVIWTGSGTRPAVDGRATITATVIGEESYIDAAPSNGRFDDGEAFVDLPEAFYDVNENGVWDVGEEYFDHNENGTYDGVDGLYNGVSCSPGATQCNTASPLLTISDSLVLVMASREQPLTVWEYQDVGGVPTPTPINEIILPDDGSIIDIHLDFADARGQQPPTGSSISVTTTTGEIVGGTTTDIVDNVNPGPATFTVSLRSTDANPEDGVLTVTLDMPESNCGALTVNHPVNIVIQDATPPSIVSSTPANADTGITLDTIIIVEFSDDMISSTFTTTNPPAATDSVKLQVAGGALVPVTTTYDPIDRSVAIFPNAPLSADTLYTLILTNAITDDSNNALNTGIGQNEIEITFRTITVP